MFAFFSDIHSFFWGGEAYHCLALYIYIYIWTCAGCMRLDTLPSLTLSPIDVRRVVSVRSRVAQRPIEYTDTLLTVYSMAIL